MNDVLLVEHADGVYTRHQPFAMMGVRIGTRMTLVRLPDGSVVVHSPIVPSADLREEIAAIGPVRHIVCPNLYHHVFAGAWCEIYPEAVLHAPRDLRDKRPDLPIARDLEDARTAEWSDALEPVFIRGSVLRETVFVHARTGTLVSSDLTENFESSDHLPTRMYLKVSGIHGRIGWSRLLRFMYRDKREARHSIDELLERAFDRVVVAHGEVIESGGKDALRQTFTFLD